ncbi:MAG TPA: hypothetical protein VGX92_09420 [Pyrinomonadaceae bacterium]|jgi:hypothetical protein|nr:hypothetical protein [Pyrinomonadaceae bacterium]
MRTNRWNLALALGLMLGVVLACSGSFTTANISSLKLGKDSDIKTETNEFKPGDVVYAVAQISNTSDKHKVKARVLFDDVQGQDSGKVVPGLETSLDVPGARPVILNFTGPAKNWAAGRYKVEVVMSDDAGKEIDKKSATFTVAGGGSNAPAGGGSEDNSNASEDSSGHSSH